jgi:hypothetical protein
MGRPLVGSITEGWLDDRAAGAQGFEPCRSVSFRLMLRYRRPLARFRSGGVEYGPPALAQAQPAAERQSLPAAGQQGQPALARWRVLGAKVLLRARSIDPAAWDGRAGRLALH